jgi:rare lipoprotein A
MKKLIPILIGTLLLGGCVTTTELSLDRGEMVATWYMHGSRTANGEKFNPDGMTAAHKTLPFGTMLRLTHRDKTVIVRINDRGPFIKGRDIDLARGAAKALHCPGVCRLKVEEILSQR